MLLLPVITLSFAFWNLSDSVSDSLEMKQPLKGWQATGWEPCLCIVADERLESGNPEITGLYGRQLHPSGSGT